MSASGSKPQRQFSTGVWDDQQSELTVRDGTSAEHLQALLKVARKRKAEPIDLDEHEVFDITPCQSNPTKPGTYAPSVARPWMVSTWTYTVLASPPPTISGWPRKERVSGGRRGAAAPRAEQKVRRSRSKR